MLFVNPEVYMHQNQDIDIIYGLHAVIEAIEAGRQIDKIWVQQESKRSPQWQALWQMARHHQIPLVRVPRSKIQELLPRGAAHQGILAFTTPITFADLEHVLDQAFSSAKVPLLLMLDKVSDVRNLGAIARTAEATGAHALIIGEKGTARLNSEAVKASAGALMHLPVCRVGSLVRAVQWLKDSGLQAVACSEKASDHYYAVDFRLPTVLVLGSEEKGIARELLELCHRQVRIPMFGKVSSLNVSVAAAVMLYEVVRQRLANR